jgi:hypothetical protein
MAMAREARWAVVQLKIINMRPPDKVPSIVEKRLSYFSMVEKNLPC